MGWLGAYFAAWYSALALVFAALKALGQTTLSEHVVLRPPFLRVSVSVSCNRPTFVHSVLSTSMQTNTMSVDDSVGPSASMLLVPHDESKSTPTGAADGAGSSLSAVLALDHILPTPSPAQVSPNTASTFSPVTSELYPLAGHKQVHGRDQGAH